MFSIFLPLNSMTMSPFASPACAAGEPGVAPSSFRPPAVSSYDGMDPRYGLGPAAYVASIVAGCGFTNSGRPSIDTRCAAASKTIFATSRVLPKWSLSMSSLGLW